MTGSFAWVDFIPSIKQSFDKNGFLICRDVPVARTGVQIYGPGETPIESVTGDVVHIERDADEVFHPETLASLQGAPVVNDHPVDGEGGRMDVTPDNWRHLAVGHVENPRRGDGVYTDFVLADLRIHDRDAIDLITKAGKRQVSAGYDADYETIGPNRGRQRNIRCNHLALVDNARCGPVCAIGDEDTLFDEEELMAGLKWGDRIRKAFKNRDQAEMESALADAEEENGGEEKENGGGGGGSEHHIHVHVPTNGGGAAAGGEGGDQGGEGGENVITISPEEVEELWSANQAEMEAIGRLSQAVGGDSPRFRDSFPHRDARRKKMGIRDRRASDQDDPDDKDDDKDGKGDDDEGANLGGGTRPILREFEMEAPAGSQVVDVRRVRDSRYLEESWTMTVAKGELIVPGARPTGTFDRAAPRERTYDTICGFRRAVLDMAYVKPDTRSIIDNFTRGRFTDAKSLTCSKVREVFDHVAEIKRVSNNSGAGGGTNGGYHVTDAPMPVGVGGINSIAEYQKQLDAHYAKKS
jgi:hypothetical protein